jgi:hypothetical protein
MVQEFNESGIPLNFYPCSIGEWIAMFHWLTNVQGHTLAVTQFSLSFKVVKY